VEVSSLLKPNTGDPGCLAWVKESDVTGALLSAISRIAHPEQYEAGLRALAAMQGLPEIAEILQWWSSIFSGVSVIANRETPVHRDVGTSPEAYDLLVTLGGDETSALHLPSMGLWMAYRTGTAVLFSGYAVPHGVLPSEAERVCFAYYMKDNVHERFGVKGVDWMNKSVYNTT
jgi:hypothetical protein